MIVESRLACSARSVEELGALLRLEHAEALLQRDRGAVHRGERRPQLVRDRRDEVRLRLVEALVLGDVAERVDDSVRETDGRTHRPTAPPAPMSSGTVADFTLRPCVSPTGIRCTAARQPGTAVSARFRITFLAGSPVISSAAWFQKRTMPCGSRRSTPSATCSRTRSAIARCSCATRVRASSGASVYAMSITAASTSSPIARMRRADRGGGILDRVVRREDGEPRRLRRRSARCRGTSSPPTMTGARHRPDRRLRRPRSGPTPRRRDCREPPPRSRPDP